MIAANATLEYAKQYLSNLEAGIEAFNQTSSLPYQLSASVGYHFLCPSASDELSDAIDMADQNMYLMKKEKKQHRLSVEYENQSAGKE